MKFGHAAIILLTMCLTVSAQELPGRSSLMSGEEITSVMPGMTMTGKYGDGTHFTETYHADGSITYVDDFNADKGRWFVRGSLFCTFYEASNGACFSVRQSGKNCYEYFIEEEEDGSKSANSGTWNSVGWDVSKPSTCDLNDKVS